MDSILLKRIEKEPNCINDIENLDDETLLYAIHFGYKYTDDIYDKFCKKDFYVRANIKKDRDFIRFFINSKHFTVDRFENDEEVRKTIINYAIDNELCDNYIIMSWIMMLDNSKEILEKAGIYFVNKNMLLKGELNSFNNIKQLYLIDNDIDTINIFINEVKKRNINIDYINVRLVRRTYSDEEINQIKDKDFVRFYSNSYKKLTVDEIIKMNKLLDLFVSDIKTSNLTPFEKYIAVYNIVKSFKKYRIFEDNEFKDFIYNDESRSVYLILNNLYMVCDGYSKLLETLLERVGIENISLESVKLNHALNYVNLVDDKYGINGFYICDVTNDNELDMMMDRGYSNIHILTKDNKYKRKTEENIDYIFDMNVEQIYQFIYNPINFKKVLDVFYKLDNNFYNIIKDREVSVELAKEIYGYLENKIDKPINCINDVNAILEVKQFIIGRTYTKEEYEFEKNKLLTLNPIIFKDVSVEEIYNKIKTMSIKEILEYKKDLDADKIGVLESALLKINDEYFGRENNMYYLLDLFDETFSFDITLDIEEIDESLIIEIVDNLNNLGYKVNYIVEDIIIFRFLLDESYSYKFIFDLYNELEVIKNDFCKVYKECKLDLS